MVAAWQGMTATTILVTNQNPPPNSTAQRSARDFIQATPILEARPAMQTRYGRPSVSHTVPEHAI